MGLIKLLLGIGRRATPIGKAAEQLSEVFVENKTKKLEYTYAKQMAALSQFGTEFGGQRLGGFDRLVNGLNRLPRPFLAFGTLGLFVFAMIDPNSFSRRMEGLALVPDPLWWLLGAIVSFYFGARELHHFRLERPVQPVPLVSESAPSTHPETRLVFAQDVDPTDPDYNAALEDWLKRNPTDQ